MRFPALATGLLAAAVLVGSCATTPAAQPAPVPVTVTAAPVTLTETATTTVTVTVTETTTAPARKAPATRPKAEDCQTGSCLNAARGLTQDQVLRERDAWLATHPGWCAAGETGAVAPC
ncbi:hypothetical protein [Amycolatopsis sp. SID8362]|uniref:hypothetical protein n=1 Tax=Amycolatopsis sp. SID8362 TaxID=2690346 RepID=UPI00136D1342|nr:hypothetical protein [Amycolatopsis sp. SID8362]NBH05712.1 hypothetical protein [Amycolatopsis sp. SID8362]NED42410.1 hypothetical protein [Amycolatopsis sp. SID8362]